MERATKKITNVKRLIFIAVLILNLPGILVLLSLRWSITLRLKQNNGFFGVPYLKWLELSRFFYSEKTQKEVFYPIIADWQEEYFEALSKKEIWKARWINVRYIYAFLLSMWQKSPIGDLIEFVIKIAKQ